MKMGNVVSDIQYDDDNEGSLVFFPDTLRKNRRRSQDEITPKTIIMNSKDGRLTKLQRYINSERLSSEIFEEYYDGDTILDLLCIRYLSEKSRRVKDNLLGSIRYILYEFEFNIDYSNVNLLIQLDDIKLISFVFDKFRPTMLNSFIFTAIDIQSVNMVIFILTYRRFDTGVLSRDNRSPIEYAFDSYVLNDTSKLFDIVVLLLEYDYNPSYISSAYHVPELKPYVAQKELEYMPSSKLYIIYFDSDTDMRTKNKIADIISRKKFINIYIAYEFYIRLPKNNFKRKLRSYLLNKDKKFILDELGIANDVINVINEY